MRWLKNIAAWAFATLTTVVAASAVHSIDVQSRLLGLGVRIPWPLRLSTGLDDFIGLAPALLAVLGGALALGFIIAAILRPRLPALAPIAFPLAGAAAVATALALMARQMAMTPIASARDWPGFTMLCVAGAIGGLVFSRLRPR